jgi:serine/threonine protein kinase
MLYEGRDDEELARSLSILREQLARAKQRVKTLYPNGRIRWMLEANKWNVIDLNSRETLEVAPSLDRLATGTEVVTAYPQSGTQRRADSTNDEGHAPLHRMSDTTASEREIGVQAMEPTEQDGPSLSLGTLLAGTYELRSLLGGGAMAHVYEAYDQLLDRRVAVKVARRGALPLLRVEGRALAAVRHRSLVTVFHFGVHDGVEYLVMERLSGASLRDAIDVRARDGNPFAVQEAIALLAAIADGLAVVHDAGLSHRDLKPENVMLAPGDRVVLMDFGLTRPDFAGDDGKAVCGTPEYMAPEVIKQEVKPGQGHLVDLYALGIVGYELLVGHTPFVREDWETTLRAHLFAAPPDIRLARPDVPREYADLVLQLLAKEPADRMDSAELVGWSLRSLPGRRPTRPPA